MTRIAIGCILLAITANAADELPDGSIPVWFRDDAGRHVIPRGFVVVTEQGTTQTDYTAADYARMVRLGANFQIIRLTLGPLGGWPGNTLQQSYLDKVDRFVALGREAGLRTVFKLTVYYCKGFDWTVLWENAHGEQDAVAKAWHLIWERYKDEASVFGYDLLNEPHKGTLPDYRACEVECLVPLYRRLIDELHAVDSEKWALYQPLLRNDADRPQHYNPFVEMLTPIERERIAYAPHTYETTLDKIAPTLQRYREEAARSGAPMMMGEWGPATPEAMDRAWEKQVRCQRIYRTTVEEFDRWGLGGMKAWFTGSEHMLKGKTGRFTWAVFRDPVAVGTAERKYLMDYVARPGPLAVAGRIERYAFDFATRTFRMRFSPDRSVETSTLYVGADRHYPDGFSVALDGSVLLTWDPMDGDTLRATEDGADTFTWDNRTQRLIVSRWPGDGTVCLLRIFPGTTGLEQVYVNAEGEE